MEIQNPCKQQQDTLLKRSLLKKVLRNTSSRSDQELKARGGGKMIFQDAVKAMKEGKKVRRDHWHKDFVYLMNEDTGIIKLSNRDIIENAPITRLEIGATDWEVAKKKTLFDKMLTQSYGVNKFHFSDVKQTLQKIRRRFEILADGHKHGEHETQWRIAEQELSIIIEEEAGMGLI